MTMTARALPTAERRWPLTGEAQQSLVDEIARLRDDLTAMAGQGLEEGIVRLPFAQAGRRLETLDRVLGEARLVADDDRCCAIGRRATLRDEDGHDVTYALVFPGDGDPGQGWISADSPLGAALLGATVGDVLAVDAPAGRWTVTVIAID